MAKVEDHVADAAQQEQRSSSVESVMLLESTFYEPTVLTGATRAMKVAREETFGPVAPALSVRDGRRSGRHGERPNLVWRLFLHRECPPDMACRRSARIRHGGPQYRPHLQRSRTIRWREAVGLGREGSHYGIDEYLEIKYLCSAIG